jgi:hypothetical protein
MLRELTIGISVVALYATNASAQTLDSFSSKFAIAVERECIPYQRAAPLNAKMSDAQIAQYCSCVARHSIEVVTLEEIIELQKTGQRPRSMQIKLNALGTTCVEVLMGKTKDGPINAH